MSDKKPVGVLSALDIFKAIKGIAEEKMQIGISGLDKDTIVYREFIREDVQKVAERFEETYGIRRVNVHIKKGKSVYTITIRVEGERETFNIRTEGPSIRDTVNMASAELRKCLSREKRMKKSRKVLKKGGLLLCIV